MDAMGTGDAVRIWFRVGAICSPAPNGLVEDGVLRPAGGVRVGWWNSQILGFREDQREHYARCPGTSLPVRKGFLVFAACGALTSESRLTREEAEGPRKDSGVRRAGVSLLGGAGDSASSSTPRSKVSGSFVPFCLELGLGSPNRSRSVSNKIESGKAESRGWPEVPCSQNLSISGFLLTHRAAGLPRGRNLGTLQLCLGLCGFWGFGKGVEG